MGENLAFSLKVLRNGVTEWQLKSLSCYNCCKNWCLCVDVCGCHFACEEFTVVHCTKILGKPFLQM